MVSPAYANICWTSQCHHSMVNDDDRLAICTQTYVLLWHSILGTVSIPANVHFQNPILSILSSTTLTHIKFVLPAVSNEHSMQNQVNRSWTNIRPHAAKKLIAEMITPSGVYSCMQENHSQNVRFVRQQEQANTMPVGIQCREAPHGQACN